MFDYVFQSTDSPISDVNLCSVSKATVDLYFYVILCMPSLSA